MARPIKTGIDYFPFDVDFFQDEKVQFVSARFGLKGEIIIIRLMCKIYRNGYYTEWNDDTALLFAKSVGDGCQDSFVKDVVYELLKRGFFDRSIFERFSVLTSRGIQNRYFEAAKRYKQVDVIGDFLVVEVPKMINVDINSINVDINPINVDINATKKRKEKEKKENIYISSDFLNFSEILIEDYDCDEQHVSDWMKVRKNKNASDTETDLKNFIDECKENNFSVKEAVKICAERSWKRFEYEWLKKDKVKLYTMGEVYNIAHQFPHPDFEPKEVNGVRYWVRKADLLND